MSLLTSSDQSLGFTASSLVPLSLASKEQPLCGLPTYLLSGLLAASRACDKAGLSGK